MAVFRPRAFGNGAMVAVGPAGTVLLLMLTVLVMAQAPLGNKATDAEQLIAIAREQGQVRVIVQLEPPVLAEEVGTDPARIADLKAKVVAAQDAIIAAYFGSTAEPRPGKGFARGLTRFTTTPGFAISVDLVELEALAQDPRVTHIAPDSAVPPLAPR